VADGDGDADGLPPRPVADGLGDALVGAGAGENVV
jgi:hypothetical protein